MLRLLSAGLLLVTGAALAVLLWPQLVGLEQAFGVAHVVSLRAVAGVAALVLALVVALLGVLVDPLRRLASAMALMLVLFTALTGIVLVQRGFGNTGFETPSEADVSVVSWNTLGDAVPAETIARLAIDADADVVALPETTAGHAGEVAALLTASGHPMQAMTVAFDQISKARSTSLLVSDRLGQYNVVNQPGTEGATSVGNTAVLPTVVAQPMNGQGPTLVAVHAVAPIPRELDHWRDDIAWLAGRCGEGQNTIVAGDFNATLDHMAGVAGSGDLGACADTARVSGNGAVGTWPASVSPLLGTPIDHVFTSTHWQVTGMRVVESLDQAGSDHRPVVAQLRALEL